MTAAGQIDAIDLFCGVGGLTHGLEAAGVNVRLGVDIDPACKYPFEQNNKARFLQADISRFTAGDLAGEFNGGYSLLAGCAPCQPFSTYSRRAARNGPDRRDRGGKDDWKLVEIFGQLVQSLQPDLVTMENVPPLKQQSVFQSLLNSLRGYSVDTKIIECQRVGLPQTRKRLVLVASRLGPIELPDFDLPTSTVREAIGSLPPLAAGGCDPHDRLHRASKLSTVNLQRIGASVPGGTWRDWPVELRAACHTRETGTTYPAVYGRMEWDGPAPTITTQCFGYGNGRFGHPEQPRAISLREAAMLQGFPRTYSFLPDEKAVSFATLGRLIGNAVPVTLGKAIGKVFTDHVAALRSD